MPGFRWLAEISEVVGESRETFHSDFCRGAYRHTLALINPDNFCPATSRRRYAAVKIATVDVRVYVRERI